MGYGADSKITIFFAVSERNSLLLGGTGFGAEVLGNTMDCTETKTGLTDSSVEPVEE